MTIECPKCRSENMDTAHFCSNCAAPLPNKKDVVPTKTIERSKEDLTTGSIFAGRYQIIEELGKGGMGRIYKVYDKEIKENIALKLLNPEIWECSDHGFWDCPFPQNKGFDRDWCDEWNKYEGDHNCFCSDWSEFAYRKWTSSIMLLRCS